MNGQSWNVNGGRYLRLTSVMLAALLVVSCSSTYKSMSVEEKRAHLAEAEQMALADLVEKKPEVQADLDRSIGHAVFSNRLAKVPVVGAGEGVGVVVDKRTGERTYLKVFRLDIGGGLGVREYRLVALFFDEEPLKKLASGKLELSAGAEAGAGKSDVGIGSEGVSGKRKEKLVLYQLADTGVSATITVRLIKYSVLDLEE
jgi:lipid-binding SYLF domain-containing protein